jgi:hypothetical protein
MPTTDTLDDQIRTLVTELMDSAPQAPTLSELEGREDRRTTTSDGADRNSSVGRRPLALAGGLVAVMAAVLLVVLLLPSVGQKAPMAAAAQLRLIADNAADQPVPQLTSNQWLETQQKMTYTVQVTEVASKPVSGATASIPGAVQQWSNNFGESCWTSTVGAARFASPANWTSWEAIDLPATPIQPTGGDCTSDAGANVTNGQGGGVVNVAGLSTDPTTLAHELQTGTTGIGAIDVGSGPPSDPSNGLARAGLLLLGPTTGSSPGLTAAVYRALALMPDITQLGEVTAHSGVSGLGFASISPIFGKRAIIVDPATGQLLELQNFTTVTPSEAMSTGVQQAYFSHTTSDIGSDGNVDWIDPVGSSRVVGSVPSELASHLPPLTAQVVATEAPGTFYSTNDLQSHLEHEFNQMVGGGPSVFHGSLVLNLDFDGPSSQVPAFVGAIKDSGLFRSVVATDGPNT